MDRRRRVHKDTWGISVSVRHTLRETQSVLAVPLSLRRGIEEIESHGSFWCVGRSGVGTHQTFGGYLSE